MIKFSFIIPAYNSEKYLSRCLESILAQDIPKNQFEIIAINDGSSDSSLKILTEYANRYQETFKIFNQTNKGIAPSRNLGLENACGEYIWFIDNDDCIKPNCLNDLYNILKSTSADILEIEYIHQKYISNPLKAEKLTEEKLFKISSSYPFYFRNEPPWSKIYKHSFIKKNNMLFVNIFGEDTVTVFRLYPKTENVFFLRIPLYAWHDTDNSFSNKINTRKHIFGYQKMIEILIDQMNESKFYDEFQYRILNKRKMMKEAFFKTEFDSIEDKQFMVETVDYVDNLIEQSIPKNFLNIFSEIEQIKDNKIIEIKSSLNYRLGKMILFPFRKIKNLFRKLKQNLRQNQGN